MADPVPVALPELTWSQLALLEAIQLVATGVGTSTTAAVPAVGPVVAVVLPSVKTGACTVSVNVTLSAPLDAVTVNVPAVELAVSVGAVAMPVVPVAITAGPLNEPEAPEAPAVIVNVMVLLGVGLP